MERTLDFFVDARVAFVISMLCLAASLSGRLSMNGARFLLLFVWIYSSVCIFASKPLAQQQLVLRVLGTMFLSSLLGFGLVAMDRWMSVSATRLGAHMEISDVQSIKNSITKGRFLRIFRANRGTLPALEIRQGVGLVITDQPLTEKEYKEYFAFSRKIVMKAMPEPVEIPPGNDKTFFEVPNKVGEDENSFEIQHESIMQGKKKAYIFVVMVYRDVDLKSDKVLVTEYGGWVSGPFIDSMHIIRNKTRIEDSSAFR